LQEKKDTIQVYFNIMSLLNQYFYNSPGGFFQKSIGCLFTPKKIPPMVPKVPKVQRMHVSKSQVEIEEKWWEVSHKDMSKNVPIPNSDR
jgi:hypothetical protein